MGFFNKLEHVDKAINRGYARWGKWVWGALSLPVLFVLGWVIWVMFWAPPMGGVTLIIHTRIDRPILGFSVNGVAGPNSSAHNPNKLHLYGGGGSNLLRYY